MKTVKLSFDIVIELGDVDEPEAGAATLMSSRTRYKGGEIKSGLTRETCRHCSQPDCCYSCNDSVASFADATSKLESEEEVAGRLRFNGAMDGIESLLLALAIAGIDMETPAMSEALETAVDAARNLI